MSQVDALVLRPVGAPELAPFCADGFAPVVIGRAEHCALSLADPSVSREHAVLQKRGEHWIVEDSRSRNGTFLNGIRILPGQPAVAASGDLLRVGSLTFRVELGGAPPEGGTITSTDGKLAPGTIVERIERPRETLAQRRLDLLIDGAVAINRARNEATLANAVLELVLTESGFHRGAVLRQLGGPSEVEVLAARDRQRASSDFTFSRTLIAEAGNGHIARLSPSMSQIMGHSIQLLGIHSALCVPIMADEVVSGYLYLDSRDAEQAGDHDLIEYCNAVARLAGLAISNLKRGELEKRQARLESDLEAARRAQLFLRPADEGSIGAMSWAMRSHPGRVVAGDLVDLFPIGEGRVALAIGDVCGQGMGAAILMTAILAQLRAHLARSADPAAVVRDINVYVAERSAANMFASLWVGVIDGAGHMRYVDAGHGHWLLRSGDVIVPPPRPGGAMIGIDPSLDFEASAIDLAAGDRIILYSDGVLEHRSSAGEEFGSERLRFALGPSRSAAEDVERALAALRAFIGAAPLQDDVTIASVEVVGSG